MAMNFSKLAYIIERYTRKKARKCFIIQDILIIAAEDILWYCPQASGTCPDSWWFGAVKQQDIMWTNVDKVL